MAIPPVKPGGYGPNDTPTAAQLAELDAKLAARGLDTQAADTTTGFMSCSGVWTTTAGKTISVTGAGAIAQATIVFGDNDVAQYLTNRTRTIHIHPAEAALSFTAGSKWRIDDNNLSGNGATYGIQNQSSSPTLPLTLPVSKPHDGATITQVVAYFQVPTGALSAAVPSQLPFLLLGRRSIATGAITTVASGTFPTPGSPAAYYNAGAPNAITLNPSSNNLMDLTLYNFVIQAIDDNTASVSNRIIWTGFKVVYGSIADARPPQ